MTRKASPWLVFLAVAGLSQTAAAAPKKVDRAEAEARATFKRAQQEYDLGQFQSALDLFSEAYRLKPLPGFLFNIAQCHRQLGQYERAAFFYKRYLDLSPDRPANAPAVEELLREVQEKERLEREGAEARRKQEQEIEIARLAAAKAEAEAKAKEDEPKPADTPLAANLQPTPASANVAAAPVAPSKEQSVLKKWWFWAGAGALAGSAAVLFVATRPPRPTLGTIDAREGGL